MGFPVSDVGFLEKLKNLQARKSCHDVYEHKHKQRFHLPYGRCVAEEIIITSRFAWLCGRIPQGASTHANFGCVHRSQSRTVKTARIGVFRLFCTQFSLLQKGNSGNAQPVPHETVSTGPKSIRFHSWRPPLLLSAHL